MDASQLERYFHPFSSSFQEGTGLGAAIVYRLVEEHGGRIHLDSERGEGTRIRIVLPSRQLEAAGSTHRDPVSAAGG
jgi:signal transduction histidine kinase